MKNKISFAALWVLVITAILNMNAKANVTYSSVYTGLKLENGCKDLTPKSDENSDSFNWFCGARSGYSVFFSGADARSGLSFTSGRITIDPVLFLQKTSLFGSFVNVTGSKLEWRYAKDSKTGKKTLIGLIFRVTGSVMQNDETFKNQDRLVVINLKSIRSGNSEDASEYEETLFSAAISNTEARAILDQDASPPLPSSN